MLLFQAIVLKRATGRHLRRTSMLRRHLAEPTKPGELGKQGAVVLSLNLWSCYHAIMLYALCLDVVHGNALREWAWPERKRKRLVLQWVLAIDLTNQQQSSNAMQSFPIILTIVALSCLLELDSLLQYVIYFIFRYISYFGLMCSCCNLYR